MINEPLHTICYISKLLDELSTLEIKRLASEFSTDNTARGVTGCMGVRRLDVMQVLEGPRDVVERLYQRIQADPRHIEITLMVSADSSSRRFEGWGMIELPYGAVVEVADQIRKIHGR